jgi:hypothetical protein
MPTVWSSVDRVERAGMWLAGQGDGGTRQAETEGHQMPGQEPSQTPDVHDQKHDRKDAGLPIPAPERRPVAGTSPGTPPDTLVQAMADAPLLGASIDAAATAAAMTGAAVAARLLWPWADWRELPRSSQPPQFLSTWLGPGVHLSYTHIEMRWPLQR